MLIGYPGGLVQDTQAPTETSGLEPSKASKSLNPSQGIHLLEMFVLSEMVFNLKQVHSVLFQHSSTFCKSLLMSKPSHLKYTQVLFMTLDIQYKGDSPLLFMHTRSQAVPHFLLGDCWYVFEVTKTGSREIIYIKSNRFQASEMPEVQLSL